MATSGRRHAPSCSYRDHELRRWCIHESTEMQKPRSSIYSVRIRNGRLDSVCVGGLCVVHSPPITAKSFRKRKSDIVVATPHLTISAARFDELLYCTVDAVRGNFRKYIILRQIRHGKEMSIEG